MQEIRIYLFIIPTFAQFYNIITSPLYVYFNTHIVYELNQDSKTID
jgi:hypothetical protein